MGLASTLALPTAASAYRSQLGQLLTCGGGVIRFVSVWCGVSQWWVRTPNTVGSNMYRARFDICLPLTARSVSCLQVECVKRGC